MAKFLKIRTQVRLDAGTDGTGTANKLTVASTSGFSVGDIVHNRTDNTFATITAIDSATVASISADIMDAAELYTVYSATQYIDKPVFAEGIAVVKRDATKNYETTINYISNSSATDIITILHQPVASVYVTDVEEAIDEAIITVHSGKTRPDAYKLVEMPSGIKALGVTVG